MGSSAGPTVSPHHEATTMAKSAAKREYDAADRAFRKAWKLLDRIERRLAAARADERRRLHQLGDGKGADAARRAAQLEAARAAVAGTEAVLTELSELIAAHSRAQSGTTVMDISREVAASIKEDAAEAPDPTPVRDRNPAARRNRHHRRKSASAIAAAASAKTAGTEAGSGSTPDLPEPEPGATEPSAEAASEPAADAFAPRPEPASDATAPETTPDPAVADQYAPQAHPPSGDGG
jgi:hypothetical protein